MFWRRYVVLATAVTCALWRANRTESPTSVNSEYFRNLLNERWTEFGTGPSTQYQATVGADPSRQIFALGKTVGPFEFVADPTTIVEAIADSLFCREAGTDMQLRWEPNLAAIAEEYASDEALFLQEFSDAWVKMMNIDRFNGPAGNLCDDDVSGYNAGTQAEPAAAATGRTARAGEQEGRRNSLL